GGTLCRRGGGAGWVETALADRPAVAFVAVAGLLVGGLAAGRVGDYVIAGGRHAGDGLRRLHHHIFLTIGIPHVVAAGGEKVQGAANPHFAGEIRQTMTVARAWATPARARTSRAAAGRAGEGWQGEQ